MIRGSNIPPIADYAHWNEDAARVWYEENKYDMLHWDEPLDDQFYDDERHYEDDYEVDPLNCSHGDTHTEDFRIFCDRCGEDLGIGCGAMVDRKWSHGGSYTWDSHEMCMIPPFAHETDEDRLTWRIGDHDYEQVGVTIR